MAYNQLLNQIFKDYSFEIMAYLREIDMYNLRLSNKYIFEVIECHLMFKDSVKALDDLFGSIITMPKEEPKSKFCRINVLL